MNIMKKTILIGLATIVSANALAITNSTASAPTTQNIYKGKEVSAIETIVHDYLLKNPQVIVDASIELQKRQEAERARLAQQGAKDNKKQLFTDPMSPVLGNPKGTVTLVEFFDYQCGYCKRMTPVVDDLIKNNKNLKVVLKEMPIFGGTSKIAAEAALAINQIQPSQYEAFHKAMIGAEGRLTKESIMQAASDLNINMKQLKKTMSTKPVSNELNQNREVSTALGLTGTPAFVLTNHDMTQFEIIGGAASKEALQEKIDDLQKMS